MNHEELLATALDAAGYFVKSSCETQSYQGLSGYTIEDIAMDAVENILFAMVPLEDLSKTYVIKATHNVALNLKRKQHLIVTAKNLPEETTPLLSMDNIEDQLYRSLTKEQRDLYTLSIMYGMSDERVGNILEISARTVRRRLVPLKLKIKEYLNGSTTN